MSQPHSRRPEQRVDEREHPPPHNPALHAVPQRAGAEQEATEGRPAESRSGEGIIPRLVNGAAAAIGRTVIGRAILPLLVLGNVSGCGPDGEGTAGTAFPPTDEPEPQQVPPEETPPEQVPAEPQLNLTRWWPGIMMRNGRLEHVYLGYDESVPYCCVDYDMMYGSREDVPPDSFSAAQTATDSLLSYMGRIFDAQTVGALLEGIVFLEKPLRDNPSAGSLGSAGATVIVDENGNQIQQCVDGVMSNQSCVFAHFSAGNSGDSLLHEMFHRFLQMFVSDEDLQVFYEQTNEFFNVYGNTPQTDRFLEAILIGAPPGQENQSFNPNTIFRNWASEAMPEMGSMASERIQWGVHAYLRMRYTLCVQTYNERYNTPDGRTALLGEEAFAYLGCNYSLLGTFMAGEPENPENTNLPTYMSWIFRGTGISDDYVDYLTSGGEYFTNRERFQTLIPYIESFCDYVRERYPEFESVLSASP